jgi:acyl carrier protein
MMDVDMLRFFSEVHEEIKGFDREVRPEDRLVEDLNLDSVDGVEFLVAIEDQYGIDLAEDERALNVRTIGELLDLVSQLMREEAPAA